MRHLALFVALAAPAAAFASVSGTVITQEGQPVAGARVRIHRPETTRSLIETRTTGAAPAVVASGTTDDAGAFTLDSKLTGVVDLLIEKDGFAPEGREVLAGQKGLTIALRPAPARSGRITAGGKPLEGALVMATRNGRFWSALTDSEGRYSVPDPKIWAPGLTIWHRGYESTHIADAGPLDAALSAGASVRGLVVDANGRPVSGATVRGAWRRTSSGDDGTFVLEHLGNDVERLFAEKEHRHGSAPNKGAEVIITLREGRSIAGTVRDADKRPLPGATVRAWTVPPVHHQEWLEAITDDRGNYSLPHGMPAQHGLLVADVADLEFKMEQVNLKAAGSARKDFVARRRPSLRGRVVDEEKRPVAGAVVQLSAKSWPLFYGLVTEQGTGSARSGIDGRFTLPLPADANGLQESGARLQATHLRFAVATSETLTPASLSSEVIITLPKGIVVEGAVVDESGAPVPGTAIILLQDPIGAAPTPIESALASGQVAPMFVSDDKGRFLVHVNRRPHDVGAWNERFPGHREGNWTPKDGETLRLVLQRGVEVRGRVVAKGRKVPAGVVQAESSDGASAHTDVAADGAFTLGPLHRGTYMLMFASENGFSEPQMVEAPAKDVVIELPASGEVRGSVIDKETGRPITTFQVSDDEGRGNVAVENEESFVLTLPAGPATLRVESEGYIAAAESVIVDSAKPAQVTVGLARGRVITGRVTSSDAVPIAGAIISVITENDEQGVRDASSDDSGEFRVDGVPKNAVTLRIQAVGYVSKKVTVDAEAQRSDVSLSSGITARGKVVSANGDPVANARVWAYSADAEGQNQQVTTSDDGSFTMEGLTAAKYAFQAMRADLGRGEVKDVIPGSEPIVISMKPRGATGTVRGTVKGFTEGGWMYGFVIAESAEGSGESGVINRDLTYRVENVPAGEARVTAHATSATDEAMSAPVTVTVLPGGEVEADLSFRTDTAVRGVVTEGGRPAPGRRVRFSRRNRRWSTTTKENGAYQITGIDPGHYEVAVEAGSKSFHTRHELKGSDTFDIRIEYAAIEGRVVDPKGAPLAGVTIDVRGEPESNEQMKTDASGTFSMTVSRDGRYTLTASKKGFATFAREVEPGTAPLHVTLLPSDGLHVRLIDARNGSSLDGYVVATDADGLQISKINERQKDGSHLVPLAPGSYRISVSASGFASRSVRANAPHEGELRIPLTPGGTLIVNVDRDASELVKLIQPDGEEYVRCQCNGIAEIRLDGTTTKIDHVAPGSYTMKVFDARGQVKASYPVAIGEGETTTVSIHVPE